MTLTAVLSGIAFVLIGILVFKMHAVLALLGGAVVTALLTPAQIRFEDNISRFGIEVQGYSVSRDRREWKLDYPVPDKSTARYDVVTADEDYSFTWRGTFVPSLDKAAAEEGRGRLFFADYQNAKFIEPDGQRSWIVPSGKLGDLVSTGKRSLGERLAFGFGRTAASIGLIIAFAAVIGQSMLHSGAASRIVQTTFSFTGEKGAPAAFVVSGFVLGIPVFFDTVFYLMIPLGKALYARTKRNYLTYVLTIICGGTMAHSLVPPTPGPLFVAGELGVPIAKMIGYGCTVGLVTAIVGYFYALFIGSQFELVPQEDLSDSATDVDTDENSPSVLLALVPIILPLGLITIASLLSAQGYTTFPGYDFIQVLGNKNIALLIAATISLLLLLKWNRSGRPVTDLVAEALASGAMIVLITGAGGAFGSILQESGLRGLIEDLPPMSTPMMLTIAFLITAAIRTAQGSATVAMITTVALFTDVATSGNLACDPVYLALAIGCGSKPLAWMADSGFWVITRLSGMTPEQGLKFITPMTGFMGVAGLIATIALATVAPGR